jgi:D-amino peptidase
MEVRLDGTAVSEYRIHALAAALEAVPVVFVSGDRALCDEVKRWNPATETVATKWGEGPSQESLHPQDAVDAIRAGVERALGSDSTRLRIPAPGATVVELVYKWASDAYVSSHYPGARQTDPHTVRLECQDFEDALRALLFLH